MKRSTILLTGLILLPVFVTTVQAVTIETVPVGNVGNAWDVGLFGGVFHAYNIGKYEVSAEEYTEFLNAVAGVDTYGLYSQYMWLLDHGCKIERYAGSGISSDHYQYRVSTDFQDRPVNYVSWGDAARFANWLHNGQPNGPQGPATTEDGAYFLNGAMSLAALMSVKRQSGAKWFIPTENEWYKAAYHKNDGVTRNYWDYPTGSDAVPDGIDFIADPTFDAVFKDGHNQGYPNDVDNTGMLSPYGTMGQGGNVGEWNETAVYIGVRRGVRGGSWYGSSFQLRAPVCGQADPTGELGIIGFRVASIPEPSTITMLLFGLASLLCWRRKK